MAQEIVPLCRIELFGSVRLIQQKRGHARFKLQKAATLLAYLALHPQRAHSRERLIDLLWPNLDIDAGRNNLSTTLSTLRRELESASSEAGAVLTANRQTIGLNAEQITTDVAEFDWLLKQARSSAVVRDRSRLLKQAIALYQGDLLEDCYEEWAITAQSAYRERYREALIDLAQDMETQQEWEEAREAAERAVRADPLQEDAALILMQVLARQGLVAKAIEVFRQFQQRLRDELEIEPTQELYQLMERLQKDPDTLIAPRPALQEIAVAAAPLTETTRQLSPHAQTVGAEAVPPVTNLPRWLTPLIGRQQELEQTERLLAQNRLLTLTGIGGCGKTRLAMQIGNSVQATYPDGVWFVELASLSDPVLVPTTVAQVLDIKEQAGETIFQTILASLNNRRMLLILDNCEHLIAACAHLTSHLLRTCPHLTILATSREALTIAGEQTYRVPSLALPDPQENVSLDSLSRYGAIQLFLERVHLVRHNFTVTEQNAPILINVCQRLDGIPLAIELAAARLRTLSVEDLNCRLDDRFNLLTGGDRTALPRQQTLRALIDWSYDLLSDPERLLLSRLSVFAGGWTQEAAEQVCGNAEEAYSARNPAATVPKEEVFSLLHSLVDKSLVLAEEQDGILRFRMLETVRQYAAEQLQKVEETEAIRGRHRDWFLNFAEEAREHLKTYQTHWMKRLETEHDNLRSALEWCTLDPQGAEAGLRLAGNLPRFWDVRGHLAEGREYLERALEHSGAQARTLLRVNALNGIGNITFSQGDYGKARGYLEESLSISKELADRWHISLSLGNLGNLMVTCGDYQAAQAFYEEGLVLCRELEDHEGIAYTLHGLSDIAYSQGHLSKAQALCEESLNLRREIHDRRGVAYAQGLLGNILKSQGNIPASIQYFQAGLVTCKELGEMWGTADILFGLAEVTALTGGMVPSVYLSATAAALRQSIGAPLSPSMQERSERLHTQLKLALGEDAFAAAWEEGGAMTWEQAVAQASGESNKREPGTSPAPAE